MSNGRGESSKQSLGYLTRKVHDIIHDCNVGLSKDARDKATIEMHRIGPW